jgi:hypothetical protein
MGHPRLRGAVVKAPLSHVRAAQSDLTFGLAMIDNKLVADAAGRQR